MSGAAQSAVARGSSRVTVISTHTTAAASNAMTSPLSANSDSVLQSPSPVSSPEYFAPHPATLQLAKDDTSVPSSLSTMLPDAAAAGKPVVPAPSASSAVSGGSCGTDEETTSKLQERNKELQATIDMLNLKLKLLEKENSALKQANKSLLTKVSSTSDPEAETEPAPPRAAPRSPPSPSTLTPPVPSPPRPKESKSHSSLDAAHAKVQYLQNSLATHRDNVRALLHGNHRRQASLMHWQQTSAAQSRAFMALSVVQEMQHPEKPVTVAFARDSPFFRLEVDRSYLRANRLGKRLKTLARTSHEWRQACTHLVDKTEELKKLVSTSWSDAEFVNRKVTLTKALAKLEAMLDGFKDTLFHVGLSMDTLLVRSVTDIRETHIKSCKESARVLQKASADSQAALRALLSIKVKKGGAQERFEAEQRFRTAQQAFELARFRHLQDLNSVHTERLLDVIDLVMSATDAWSTFYNEGHQLSQTLEPGIERFKEKISIKRPRYEALKRRAQQQETELAHSLNEPAFNIAALFPDAETEEEKKHHTAELRGHQLRVEKQGYLFKRAKMFGTSWNRRWFALQDGQLYYIRSSEDLEPQHVCDALVSTIKPSTADDLPFCFDVISPNKRKYTLQAECKEEYEDWLQTFQNCTENLLISGQAMDDTNKDKATRARHASPEMKQLRALNSVCADCGQPDPDWISINLGIAVCIRCSGVHRSLGTHISKVRSLTLDQLPSELVQVLLSLGNSKVNQVYQYAVPSDQCIHADSSRPERDAFIGDKYRKKSFLRPAADDPLLPSPVTPASLGDALLQSAQTSDVLTMYKLVAYGVDLQYADDQGRTALHHACLHNQPVAVEFLTVNNAPIHVTDKSGHSPYDLASSQQHEDVLRLISQKG